jgi:HEAT repeat protein
MTRRRAWLAGVLVLTMGMVIWVQHEPHYRGRSLTSWLQQCWDAPGNETQRLTEAQEAISTIGAKKALPRLLSLVEASDDPISQWLIRTGEQIKLSDDYGDRFIRWHSAEDLQWLGERGFEALGTNAAPVAEQLGMLLNKPDRVLVIERCLESIGQPAELVIWRTTTNQDAALRQWAINELASVTDDVGVYIARIKPRLHDSSDAVRATVVEAIGLQTTAPELAVPLLIEALKDPSVSAKAANSLAGFGTNALAAYSQLTNLVENGNENVAGAALRTLTIIAPASAFPIFTNYLAHGKPGIEPALQAFTQVAPVRVLPIVLDRLRSPDVQLRRQAFGLLRHYPATPQIESAMQVLVTDSDSGLALGARGFLTDQYAANHSAESSFSDEPSFGGKRLGEWLEVRLEGGGDLTPAAKHAIQHLGTNAIPALFKRLVYMWPPYCFSRLPININAAVGFIALGDQAKPALPELETLMDSTNKDIALAALISTCGTGSNAIPFLIRGLTNQFANVRNEAANILTSDLGNQFPEQRKPAIPFFVKRLQDTDEDVRMNATNQLKQIDPATAAQAGIK